MNQPPPDFSKIASLFQMPIAEPSDSSSHDLNKVGETPDESSELGRISLSDGNYELAIKHFRKAVEQRGASTPEDAIDLGAAYEYADQAPQAYRQYLLALEQRKDSPDVRFGLAGIMQRAGRGAEALQSIQELIDAEPDNAYYRIKLAEALRENGYPKKAVGAAQEAVLAKPDESFYHYWLGDLLLELGRTQEALDSLRAAIELSPGDDHLYVKAAVGFWRLGRKQEAVKSIRLASDLDPDKPLYHGLLEALLDEMELHEEADLESPSADRMDSFDHDTLRRTLDAMGIQD